MAIAMLNHEGWRDLGSPQNSIELRNSSSELPDPGSVNAADIAGGWIAKDNVT